ncbi:GNAT family N-acetyltransferase [Aestuariivita sp.]|jgi:RimJ/RimL family protein N-acetyltransferase|uniref:GNAT family N-acetyltransferase n=1 Tax=Aestuariivita sp. TaxID=1872407 RepID=UPI002173D8E9|nr:GNAT family N-acetyltransferase [Aestuariivita sp.]MCE8007293.1 GNAT family N-acetyltransferase [Aestuariivita sp.]
MTPLSTHIPRIETARLILRGHEARDFAAFATMLADPRMKYMGGPFNRDAAWDYFANNSANWCLHGFGAWTLTDKEDRFLGDIGILKPDAFPEPELGWSLGASAEGNGYAQEGARAALDWYWAASDAPSIVSYITPGNTRSEALATCLGATPDPNAPLPRGETADDTTVYRHRRPQ